MLLYPNGYIVQQLDRPYCVTKNIVYRGISAYHQYPLLDVKDSACAALSQEVFSKKIDDNLFQSLEFISDPDLFERYVAMCDNHQIPIRCLFIHSDYKDEIWLGEEPKTEFIGYEYCEIPFDCQVVYDLDHHKLFEKHRNNLNALGLFETLNDAIDFKKCYDKLWSEDLVGDGGMDTFICKVSELKRGYVK